MSLHCSTINYYIIAHDTFVLDAPMTKHFVEYMTFNHHTYIRAYICIYKMVYISISNK